jgi:hypothetical protein
MPDKKEEDIVVEDQLTKTVLEGIQKDEESKKVLSFDKKPEEKGEKKTPKEEVKETPPDKEAPQEFKIDGKTYKVNNIRQAMDLVEKLNGPQALQYLNWMAQQAGLQLVKPGEEKKSEKKTDFKEILGEDMEFAGPGIKKLVESVLKEWAEKEILPRFNQLQTSTQNSAEEVANEKLATQYDDFEEYRDRVIGLLQDYPRKSGSMYNHMKRLYLMAKADDAESSTIIKRRKKIDANAENDLGIRSTDLEDEKVKPIDQEPESIEDALRFAARQLLGNVG